MIRELKVVVLVKTQSLSLAVVLCFYVIFSFSTNPFVDNFFGMAIEVTDQNNEGVFSSLSRNFDQTIEDINSADEESTTSTSTDSSESTDEESTDTNIPGTTSQSSNLISSNSTTTTTDLEKKNQTDTIN